MSPGQDSSPAPIGDAHTLAATPAATPLATPLADTPRAPSTLPERLATLAARLPRIARDAYTVGDEVAQGGIGRVVQARDHRLDRPVAIKELLVWNGPQEQRFVREALLTARLQHPAIVPIYEAGRWPDGEPFYAMKLVSGRSLAELIAGRQTLPERLALLPHVLAVAQAIAYAHSEQIIHRDLKPANVLVGKFGETVVIDWGLAKDLAEVELPGEPAVSPGEGLTIQGAVMGTPSYMPPEQASGAPVDERADVYAIGAMLYHLLAARPPYHGQPWPGVLLAIVEGPPRPIEEFAPQLSDELAAIVHKAMARDPAARYRTAEALADDLERYQAGQVVAAHTYSAAQLLRRYWRRNRSALSVAAAALALVALVAVVAFLRTDRARQYAEQQHSEAVEASIAADTARHAAELAEAQATTRADGMTLLQAEDALRRNPNRALAWLRTLSSAFTDVTRMRRIAADARNRGISRAFHGHTAYINRFAISADGARFVTASDDKTARIWDAATGDSLLLIGHSDEIWNAQFAPGDAQIATIGKDSTLHLWDAHTGREQARIPVPGPTRQLIMRSDGAILGGHVDLGAAWIRRPGAPSVERLTDPDEHPRWVHLSRDGLRLLVQPEDADAYLRDVDGTRKHKLPGTRGAPGRWFLDHHGDLALHLGDHDATLWQLTTRTPHPLGVTSPSRRPAFSARGDRLALAVGHDIHIHDTRSAALVQRLVGHEDGPVQSLQFAADDRRLVSTGVDRTVRSWDLASGQSEVHAGLEGLPTEAELFADGRSILAVSSAGEVRLFDTRRAGKVLTDHAAPATGLALGADRRVASIDDHGRLHIRDLDGRSIATHTVSPAPQLHLAAAPDARSFAGLAFAWITVADGRHPDLKAPPATLLLADFAGAAPRQHPLPAAGQGLAWLADSSAVIVALGDGVVLRVTRDGATTEIDRFAAPATSLAVAPDGRWLAAGSEDGSLHLHDLRTGRVRPLPAHGERVTALAFTADGTWLASGCADHTARLWRSDDASFRAFDEGGHGVEQLAFTPDGRTLLLLSGGETELRRLDLATGEHRPPLAGHGGALLGFTIADDGRRVLTHGASGAVHLIDMADGHGRTLTGHTRRVTGAGFAAGGRTIVTLGLEGSVRAWPDDLPETMPELRAWIDAAASGRVPEP